MLVSCGWTDLEGDEEVSCVMYVSCVMCVIIIVTRDIAWFRARCTVPVALPECVGGSWGWLRLRAASVSSEFRSAHWPDICHQSLVAAWNKLRKSLKPPGTPTLPTSGQGRELETLRTELQVSLLIVIITNQSMESENTGNLDIWLNILISVQSRRSQCQ